MDIKFVEATVSKIEGIAYFCPYCNDLIQVAVDQLAGLKVNGYIASNIYTPFIGFIDTCSNHPTNEAENFTTFVYWKKGSK
jgi:hypothetical protein